ncbi:MAG TPA: response regulator [Deltaproteobacteria bacterium]|nr:response regulator [Deltaproteobacteria bacterium]
MKKRRILVVDDEEIIRYSLVNILSSRGFEVDEASTAEKALELLYKKSYHLVITDLVLQGLGGLELLENVKVISPKTIVIVITGYGSLKSAIAALRLGVYDYLLKPCDESELMLRIERALEMQGFGMEQKRLQELNAITKTTVTLSDKINTPLNVILGNIEMLQVSPDLEGKEKVQGTLKVIEEQVFGIKDVMDKLARLTSAQAMKHTTMKDYEIIDLTSGNGDD